jgi:ABC-type enterobactin transport system permease subunit
MTGLFSSIFVWEEFMQMVITLMAVVAGLIFSVAVALLAEEFIFGQVFRLFFTQQPVQQPVRQMVPQAVPMRIGQKR